MNRSIPTNSPIEFLNIVPLNNMISKCEIKVLYAGKNRNKSYIEKDVANNIARTLPGTPIVGIYLLNTEDFGDHGEEELVIDKFGVRFVKNTVPYGFVPTDAKVWWKEYIDSDGNAREYLSTEGYLWTGRFPECKRVVEQGNHQSMEFDPKTIKGEWANIDNEDTQYFKISEANFLGLCILGEEVEPAFQGANITKNSQIIYSLDKEEIKNSMLDFMLDLKEILNIEGGERMDNLQIPGLEDNQEPNVPVVDPETVDPTVPSEPEQENSTEPAAEPSVEDDFAKKKKDDDEEDDSDEKDGDSSDCDPEDEDEKKKKKAKYSLEEVEEYQVLLADHQKLQDEYNLVVQELEAIKPEYSILKENQAIAVSKQKDEMIGSFYMLSDEDKKEVIENKDKYSLEEIESKLSVICVRNKVNFNLDNSDEFKDKTETPVITFSVNPDNDSTPAWIKAVQKRVKK